MSLFFTFQWVSDLFITANAIRLTYNCKSGYKIPDLIKPLLFYSYISILNVFTFNIVKKLPFLCLCF